MDLRGTPQQVFARMPDTIRETMRRAWDKGHQYFEVPVYEDRLMERPLLKAEDAQKLRYYRFTLRDIFDAEGLAALAMVDPVMAMQMRGTDYQRKRAEVVFHSGRQCGKTTTVKKGLFNRLPFEEQFKARRGYDEGATGYTTDIPGVGRVDFDLRAIFSFPPGKPPSRWETAVREDMEKTVADGVDALHLGGFGEAFKAKRAEVAAVERDLARQLDIQIGVDPGMGPDQAVMVSYDEQGRVSDAVWLKTSPPCKDVAEPVQVYESNWPYDVCSVEVPEPPNNTPRGLLMVAPMDYRLGQWRAC